MERHRPRAGQRDDLTALLARDLPAEQWPVLRTLVSRHTRQVGEERFPRLAARMRTTSAA
ncbi:MULTISPECIES: hypothetical protein [unclassified Streptomyces]|uniref:hypothetical protein n=1 Tax=unclassified Streptomyces TaxID=2593676 RepID=UPI00343C5DED